MTTHRSPRVRFPLLAAATGAASLLLACEGSPTLPGPETGPAEAARLAGSAHGGRPLAATLDGPSEVPGPGDPDGTGAARITLNQGQREVCFEIQVADILLPAIGAHIHRGTADVAGPIVVPLTPPDGTGTSSGCVEDVARELIKEIRKRPAAFYVNVHTTDFPAGAVRGQLSK